MLKGLYIGKAFRTDTPAEQEGSLSVVMPEKRPIEPLSGTAIGSASGIEEEIIALAFVQSGIPEVGFMTDGKSLDDRQSLVA